MSCKLEPIPTKYHTPGTLLLSPGGSFIYEILSYPVCRLYADDTPGVKYPLQPNTFEYRKHKKKGQGNYLSYLAIVKDGTLPFFLTDVDFSTV